MVLSFWWSGIHHVWTVQPSSELYLWPDEAHCCPFSWALHTKGGGEIRWSFLTSLFQVSHLGLASKVYIQLCGCLDQKSLVSVAALRSVTTIKSCRELRAGHWRWFLLNLRSVLIFAWPLLSKKQRNLTPRNTHSNKGSKQPHLLIVRLGCFFAFCCLLQPVWHQKTNENRKPFCGSQVCTFAWGAAPWKRQSKGLAGLASEAKNLSLLIV